jgi:hypothetical protein
MGGSICCGVLDHFAEGFRGSVAVLDRDKELVGMASTRFWFNSTREATGQGV